MRLTHAPRTCGVRVRSAFAARRKVNAPAPPLRRAARRRCTSSAEQSDTQRASELSRVFTSMHSALQQSLTTAAQPAAQPSLLVRTASPILTS